MKKRLLIIDANSLIHRAFHALPPFYTRKGKLTNAVYGFLLVLFKAIKEFEPDYIAAAFDVPGPTKRHKEFKEYKAKREKAADELYEQIPMVKEMLGAMNIATYEKEGFEADDIIGTISKKAPRKQVKPPLQTIIVSGDLDMLQLVDKNTKIYTQRKGLRDSVLYDEGAVKKRFSGLEPKQLIDFKGLRGDPSDNIPGVTGVGEKTAIHLLLTFGSLNNMYKALEKGTDKIKEKLADTLLQYRDQALLSRKLGTIDCETPITINLKDLAWDTYDRAKAEKALLRLEFSSLLKTLPRVNGAKGENGFKTKESVQEKIEQMFKDKVFSKKVYELEKELVSVLRTMEKIGIAIDKKYFLKLEKETAKELKTLRTSIHRMGGREFNVNSTQQLSEILFSDLDISKKGLKKTPKGVISTASPELEKLRDSHPIIDELLWYRELQKLYSTYIVPIPRKADKASRVHTTFDQLGTATGRISSFNPNLQNIPIQTEWGRKIRKGFVAKKGYQLVSFDYSQMELRLAAHIAKDKKMSSFFAKGADIHQMTAAEVFGVKPEKVTKEMRFRAKALNFGVLYGMGARGFARSAKISMEEAQDFIDDYFINFPDIKEYIENTKEFVKEHGYTETLFGRKRFLPDIISLTPRFRAAAERMAVNMPIQGSSADVIKMAMVEISKELPKERLLLQIHDELLFELKPNSKSVPQIQHIMEQAGNLKLKVDVKAGDNWDELKII